jgi:hypothetical protein
LSHLHQCAFEYERVADGKKPATVFTVDVDFGLHCFSCDPPKDRPYDHQLRYADAHHIRIFDFERYELSKRLPHIIKDLAGRKCFNAGRGNFFTVEAVDKEGKRCDYDIFIQVSKSARRGRLNLFVQSAYIRERVTLPQGRPIQFLFILHNVLNGIKIKA